MHQKVLHLDQITDVVFNKWSQLNEIPKNYTSDNKRGYDYCLWTSITAGQKLYTASY